MSSRRQGLQGHERGDFEEISAGQGETDSVQGVDLMEYLDEEFGREEEET
jgi:hypothetical protein